MPEIELEGENLADLKETASREIEGLWQQYGERPLTDNNKGGEEIKSFTGETLLYNDDTHSYYDLEGNKMLSGSYYASGVMPKFNRDGALIGSSKKYGVDKKELGQVWDMLGDVSRSYGNAVHYALELYHNHNELGAKVAEGKKEELNYALSKIPHLQECVNSFVEKFGTDAELEVLVSDVKNLRAGRVDRLQIIDKKNKVCRVGDFKTNYELTDKKQLEYQHQLSFYAHILQAHGWTVEGLDIYHYSGEWNLIPLDVLDLVEKE
jgi:predicted RecB family nuclease